MASADSQSNESVNGTLEYLSVQPDNTSQGVVVSLHHRPSQLTSIQLLVSVTLNRRSLPIAYLRVLLREQRAQLWVVDEHVQPEVWDEINSLHFPNCGCMSRLYFCSTWQQRSNRGQTISSDHHVSRSFKPNTDTGSLVT